MSTYVLSDIHGRLRTLDRLLEKASLGEADELLILGDMVDRGPGSVDVMKLCRTLPNTTVLQGNHEQLMLAFFDGHADPGAALNWAINGGMATATGLAALKGSERDDLLDWVRGLGCWAVRTIAERTYILVHAGIRSATLAPDARDDVRGALAAQDPDDLVWIREGYLDRPTGLLDEAGAGPIVVAGHTPTVLAETMADVTDRPALDEHGRCQMLSLGAVDATAHTPDRLVIDCGAGSVPENGRLLLLRLDDMHELYEDVLGGD